MSMLHHKGPGNIYHGARIFFYYFNPWGSNFLYLHFRDNISCYRLIISCASIDLPYLALDIMSILSKKLDIFSREHEMQVERTLYLVKARSRAREIYMSSACTRYYFKRTRYKTLYVYPKYTTVIGYIVCWIYKY